MKIIKETIVTPAVMQPAVTKSVLEEVSGEGLESLMGKRVTLMCASYFYTGDLIGVNVTCVKLANAGIVYDTGSLNDKKWQDMQSLPGDWYVQVAAIESFGILK